MSLTMKINGVLAEPAEVRHDEWAELAKAIRADLAADAGAVRRRDRANQDRLEIARRVGEKLRRAYDYYAPQQEWHAWLDENRIDRREAGRRIRIFDHWGAIPHTVRSKGYTASLNYLNRLLGKPRPRREPEEEEPRAEPGQDADVPAEQPQRPAPPRPPAPAPADPPPGRAAAGADGEPEPGGAAPNSPPTPPVSVALPDPSLPGEQLGPDDESGPGEEFEDPPGAFWECKSLMDKFDELSEAVEDRQELLDLIAGLRATAKKLENQMKGGAGPAQAEE